jgi:hypothetical protein
LLDELHAELARTGISDVLAPSVGADHPKILNSLREILLAVERDASPGAFIAGGVATLFAGERLKSIRACLERLPGLLLERVQRRLAPERILVLRSLLSLPVPDFLDVLGHATNENSNSSMLAYLLNPRTAPTVGPATLTELVACLEESEQWRVRVREAARRDAITVQRECPVVQEGTDEEVNPRRIDIVVWGPDFVLAIENKVLAREHGEQTRAYWDWLATHRIAHAGIFLSPAGFPARSQNFKPVSYLELLAALLEGPALTNPGPTEKLVLASYVKTLASGLLRTELRAIHQMEDHAP